MIYLHGKCQVYFYPHRLYILAEYDKVLQFIVSSTHYRTIVIIYLHSLCDLFIRHHFYKIL